MTRGKYSEAFISAVRELSAIGLSVSDIGQKLGVTKGVISGIRTRHGMTEPIDRPRSTYRATLWAQQTDKSDA